MRGPWRSNGVGARLPDRARIVVCMRQSAAYCGSEATPDGAKIHTLLPSARRLCGRVPLGESIAGGSWSQPPALAYAVRTQEARSRDAPRSLPVPVHSVLIAGNLQSVEREGRRITRNMIVDLRTLVQDENATVLAICQPSTVEDWRELAKESCSDNEWQRAERYRFDWLRRRFLCGRTMLRYLLAYLEGGQPRTVRLESSETGRLLILHSELRVSLSYSEDMVAVLVGCGSLGLDIENIDRRCDTQSIAAHAFREEERRPLKMLSPSAAREHFFRVWVEKEAVAKALGLGLAIGFEQLDAQRTARSMGSLLRTFWLDPSHLAATVLPESCTGIIETRWGGGAGMTFAEAERRELPAVLSPAIASREPAPRRE